MNDYVIMYVNKLNPKTKEEQTSKSFATTMQGPQHDPLTGDDRFDGALGGIWTLKAAKGLMIKMNQTSAAKPKQSRS